MGDSAGPGRIAFVRNTVDLSMGGNMNMFVKTAMAAALGACLMFANTSGRAADPPKKNWTAPTQKIYAQKLSDETMAKHPELLSVTLHGVPPGQENDYTMFAGSFPERIGNPDDPD